MRVLGARARPSRGRAMLTCSIRDLPRHALVVLALLVVFASPWLNVSAAPDLDVPPAPGRAAGSLPLAAEVSPVLDPVAVCHPAAQPDMSRGPNARPPTGSALRIK